MRGRISIRPAASIDIDAARCLPDVKQPQTAMRFFDAARQTFATLARMPKVGRIYRNGEDETLE
ncbi:MAG: hypothetical protein JOZ78_17570 [Chroococcidiopsidaceae cyanobacterium CP_BM_ER_R8_30]|nr:hypothetical protein [Chroococcidiopsidaceae cyanobacterium CP_BM_ER_R8_30]